MKLSYKKKRVFKFFGIKIFEFNTDYIEHSIDIDSSDDDFNIDLNTVVVRND